MANKKGCIDLKAMSKSIPLDIRIKVSVEMHNISMLTELGFRENKMWTPEEDELLEKLMKSSHKLSDIIMNDIKEWEDDGSPT